MNKPQLKSSQFDTLRNGIIKAMQDKKAVDIVSINLRKLKDPVTEMFIICHGNSDVHVETIAKNIEAHVKKTLKEIPLVKEGYDNCEWVLIDYFDIVVHVFQEEKRDFYGLEDLWGDGEVEKFN